MGTGGRSRSLAALGTLAAATFAVALVGSPAGADPPLPEAADPAASAVSPLADEVPPCGHLSLGLVAVDLAVQTVTATVGPALPPAVSDAVLTAYGRAFLTLFQVDSAACDAIPTRQFATTCDADDQVAAAIARVPLPGLPVELGVVRVPTEPALVGALIDAIAAVEREASTPASPSQTLAAPLGCETVERLAGSPVAPGIGSVEVDLTSPDGLHSANDDNRVLGNTVDRGAPSAGPRRRAPGREFVSSPAPAPSVATGPGGVTEAATGVAAAANSGDGSTRRSVYFVLFLLTAAGAVVGFGRRVDATA